MARLHLLGLQLCVLCATVTAQATMARLHLLGLQLWVLCGTVTAQAGNSGDADVSMWQRAADNPSVFAPGGVEVPDGIFDIPNSAVNCLCVEFYQCTSDNWLKTTGEGVIGTRLGENDRVWNTEVCPNATMVCCRVPNTVPIDPPLLNQPNQIDVPDRPTCGVQKASDDIFLRIKDGDEAEAAEFPWMLALMNVLPMSDGGEVNIFACGASLIHPRAALTAAHCITVARKSYPNVRFKVRAGEWDTATTDEILPHQDQDVEKVIMPDRFNTATLVNDIALLVLAHPLELADNVGTICLPEQGDQFVGSKCVATGWGRGNADPSYTYEEILHKVKLQVSARPKCQEELRKTRLGPRYTFNPSFLCASGEIGKDTCKGDGGGPLVCPSPHNPDHHIQVGIVSWGVGCGNGTPAVYTDVSRQRDWIETKLASEGIYAESAPTRP